VTAIDNKRCGNYTYSVSPHTCYSKGSILLIFLKSQPYYYVCAYDECIVHGPALKPNVSIGATLID